MKSFVKALWSRTKADAKPRELNHPSDLMVQDMIQLSDSFALPPRLRNQTFKVIGIVTYQFEHEYSTSFSLEGINQDHIDLTVTEEGGRASAEFSLSIAQDQVEQIFNLDQFSEVFDGQGRARVECTSKLDLEAWLDDSYVQRAHSEAGYFYNSDCRGKGPSTYEGDGEPFQYHSLVNQDQSKAVEIEVYEGGETEVSLTLYRPIEDIKELWPAEKK